MHSLCDSPPTPGGKEVEWTPARCSLCCDKRGEPYQIKFSPRLLIRDLCNQNGEDFERLVLHTEVRWLSKGLYLILWHPIASFLANTQLGEQLLATKCDVFYLSAIFEKRNSLNEQLQGKDADYISSKGAIVAFLRKLQSYKNNSRRRGFVNHGRCLSFNSFGDSWPV